MEFSITIETDINAERKSGLIQNLSDELSIYFKNRNYGDDIFNYVIGCICIKNQPGYENWYKKRNPKYKENEIIKLLDGTESNIVKSYSYDIKIDGEEYDAFVEGSEIESLKILAKKIIQSLSNLESLPKKVKDFDKEAFKADLIDFFIMKNLAPSQL